VPVQGFWDRSIDARCDINDSKFFFGTVLAHLVLDVVILALPVIQVYQLKLPVSQKIAISAMFTFGILSVTLLQPPGYLANTFAVFVLLQSWSSITPSNSILIRRRSLGTSLLSCSGQPSKSISPSSPVRRPPLVLPFP
jgi:hypothetical protein